MIIKEFRLVLPIGVDEYEIGNLYTVQKMSRVESTGTGSGVEIIENRPYEIGNEKGQYTRKLLHVSERLPSALKTITNLVFPKSALIFEEECWNYFPTIKTKYHYKLSKNFHIHIDSKFSPDLGNTENVFNLSNKELSVRIVDYVDIVNDPINPNEYKEEEDPVKFVSKINNFGPLKSNWLEELKKNADPITNESILNNQKVKYMCIYKLCRVEVPIWGFQSKVEKLILDSVIRPLLLTASRRGWCWQDEYHGLTIEDIRRLEKETEEYLRKKMNGEPVEEFKNTLPVIQQPNFNNESEKNLNGIKNDVIYNNESDIGESEEYDEENNIDEFYDAISQVSLDILPENFDKIITKKSMSVLNLETCLETKFTKDLYNEANEKTLFRNKIKKRFKDFKGKNNTNASGSVFSNFKNYTASTSGFYVKNDILILVVHGGNITCTDTSKQNDFSNFKSTMETVIKSNNSQCIGRIFYRLVSCDSIIKESLLELSAISPTSAEKSFSIDESDDFAQASVKIISYNDNLPYNTLPLLALANQNSYKESLKKFSLECNKVYQQFLSSDDGLLFKGQVVIVGDSLGSLLVYDSLHESEIQYDSNSTALELPNKKLEFDVAHFFVFGSPLGLVLAQRKIANGHLDVPCSPQIYNLFHLTDPIAIRIEPLLLKSFRFKEPYRIPRYSKLPFEDGLILNSETKKRSSTIHTLEFKSSNLSSEDLLENILTNRRSQIKKNWSGETRIDYVLYAPKKISILPKKSLPYIFHSCYWESTDVAAFIIRMIFNLESNSMFINEEANITANNKETWINKLNRVKFRTLSENNKKREGVRNRLNLWKLNFVSKDGISLNRKSN